MATCSGLAATCLIVNLLKAGDHILCCDDVYGGLFVCLFVSSLLSLYSWFSKIRK